VKFEGYEDDDPEHVALEHIRASEVGVGESSNNAILPSAGFVIPVCKDTFNAR
jgi:hypothetical protein